MTQKNKFKKLQKHKQNGFRWGGGGVVGDGGIFSLIP
jgi:hypothetical protein